MENTKQYEITVEKHGVNTRVIFPEELIKHFHATVRNKGELQFQAVAKIYQSKGGNKGFDFKNNRPIVDSIGKGKSAIRSKVSDWFRDKVKELDKKL